MNRNLVFISVQPQNPGFIWQVDVQLNNFRKYGLSDSYHVIFFVEQNHEVDPGILELIRKYPETKFFFYKDIKGECLKLISSFNYLPLLRPWCLKHHFKAHPELTESAVFYLDSDVVFTKSPDFLTTEVLNDNINYLSNTEGYNSAAYFDSKIKDVEERKLDDYKKIDVLDTSARMCGITRETCEQNQSNTGGAQYLLKNIDSRFWDDVLDGCMMLSTYLRNINQRFFKGSPGIEREHSGFQSWCADMWAVLWTLWKRKYETKTPKFMDFVWSNDSIQDIHLKYMYHDAGASDDCFDKTKYRDIKGINPFNDDFSWVNKEKASYFYVQEIKQTNNN